MSSRRTSAIDAKEWGVLLLLMLLAAVLRVDFQLASNWVLDADEAIVGLMAKHISEGGEIPVFYYGQPYMGSLEAILAAAVFVFTGATAVALKSVPLFCSIALVPVLYLLGSRVGGRIAARVSATLWAVPPSALLIWSGMARGGFMEVILLCGIALLLAMRWAEDEQPSLLRTVAVGFILGVAWWVNNQSLFFIGPIGLLFIGRLLQLRYHRWRALCAHGSIGILSWLLGGAPFWWYNLTHDWASITRLFGSSASGAGVLSNAAGLYNSALPMIFGARGFWHSEDIFPLASTIAYASYALVALGVIGFRWNELRKLLQLKVDRFQPVEILSVFVVSTLIIFAVSSFGSLYLAPRYLLPLYLGLFPLVGYVVAQLWRAIPPLAVGIPVTLVAIHLASCYLGGRALPGQPFVAGGERVSESHEELIQFLDQQRITCVRTNYWIGYRLAFETQERVQFAVFKEPREVRIPEYERCHAAELSNGGTFVLVPSQVREVRTALTAARMSFSETKSSGYVVIHQITPLGAPLREIPSERMQLAQPEGRMVLDRDRDTRWGSRAPQSPGMEFSISFTAPQMIRGIKLEVGRWLTDDARALMIEGITPDGKRVTLLTQWQFDIARSLRERRTELMLGLPPTVVRSVVLRQMRSHPTFDWSIAELSLYE